jgi:cytoskeletal protein CcmA (bactofilin family)
VERGLHGALLAVPVFLGEVLVPQTRRLMLFILPLLVAAAGSLACSGANPAGPSPSGATIAGSFVADRAMSGVTVAVSGTKLGAAIGASQRFTIRGVPAGAVRLLFRGAALNGAIDLKRVEPSETIELVVRVNGSTVALDSEQRRREDDDDDADDDNDADDADDAGPCPLAGANKDLDLVGDCTITGHVNGNIEISNGTLIVDGSVDGNIEQSGVGGVTVRLGGFVNGNVKEAGTDGVTIGGTVNGKIEEEGGGDVVISGPGYVKGDVIEKGLGDVEVNGTVDGNVEESEAGSVVGTGTLKGNVKESGPGSIAPGVTVNGKREASG